MIAALMIGRKGSVGFPGKNTILLSGHPMASYPLRAVLGCELVDKTFVSTDDPAIIEIAAQLGGIEIIHRPAHLCTKEALGEDALHHGAEEIQRRCGGVEMFVLLMANAPTISSELISQGIEMLRKNPEADSAVTVSRYNMFSPTRGRKVDARGFLEPFIGFEALAALNATCDRDSQGDCYFADMGASIVRPRCFEEMSHNVPPQKWMGRHILPIFSDGGVDVDYPYQVGQAEYWVRTRNLAGAD